MYAVIFEVLPSESGYQRYLDIAAALRPKLDAIDGFISIERFKSVSAPGWVLSLSLWRDEAALMQWRSDGEHHAAQAEGRDVIFNDYRIRVARILAPPESAHGVAQEQALVGFWDYAPADAGPGKRYESLMDAGKHVVLRDFTGYDAALAWQSDAAAKTAPPARVLCGTVLRDYGLFNRQQAPQHFPERRR